MPNIASVLKDEIRRLARKEIRQQIGKTRRAAAHHRRQIAQLKRLIALQDRKIKVLESREPGETTAAETDESIPPGTRFSARSVRAQRRRLKLSAEQYAKLIGVSPQTVYHWEQGKARPRRAQLAALVAVRAMGRREALQRLDEMDD
jgi:DNA-binding transcriptional regulator YiaG